VNGQSPERGGIRHPAVAKRIALVRRAAEEPGFAAKRLRRSAALLWVVNLLAALAIGRGALAAIDEARSPIGPRLVAAARERLEGGDSAIARDYAERAAASHAKDALSVLEEIEHAASGR
jgi:hypothetical protein